MRMSLLLVPVITLAGCGNGISGDYGGPNCGLFQKISFRSGGVVYLTLMGTEMSGQYRVDGDKISLTIPNEAGIVLTRKGSALEGTMAGETYVCNRL